MPKFNAKENTNSMEMRRIGSGEAPKSHTFRDVEDLKRTGKKEVLKVYNTQELPNSWLNYPTYCFKAKFWVCLNSGVQSACLGHLGWTLCVSLAVVCFTAHFPLTFSDYWAFF